MGVHRTIYCRSASPGSLGIRVLDGMRQWGHQAGILADGEHCIEARALPGVVITPLADIIRRSSEFVIVARPAPYKAAGDAWARGTVGCRYDWMGAFGVRWNRRWQHPDLWFCSEHDEMWQAMNGLLRFRADTRGVSPNDSYAVL